MEGKATYFRLRKNLQKDFAAFVFYLSPRLLGWAMVGSDWLNLLQYTECKISV
jgi:hypothetical protein